MTHPLDLRQTPYSCRGSYLALSHLSENYQGKGNADGLHLRTIHNCTLTPLIARITLLSNGQTADLPPSWMQLRSPSAWTAARWNAALPMTGRCSSAANPAAD